MGLRRLLRRCKPATLDAETPAADAQALLRRFLSNYMRANAVSTRLATTREKFSAGHARQ